MSPSSTFLSLPISASRRSWSTAVGERGAELVGAADDVVVLLHAGVVDAAEHVGEVGGVDEPDRDRLAVGERVVGVDLERVGQRVAVVQQRPPPALAFVAGHDLGLDLARSGRCARSRPSPAGRRR